MLTGAELHAAIAERVAEMIDGRVELYRIMRYAATPPPFNGMYYGKMWEQHLASESGKQLVKEIENELWREAFCEALARLAKEKSEP